MRVLLLTLFLLNVASAAPVIGVATLLCYWPSISHHVLNCSVTGTGLPACPDPPVGQDCQQTLSKLIIDPSGQTFDADVTSTAIVVQPFQPNVSPDLELLYTITYRSVK